MIVNQQQKYEEILTHFKVSKNDLNHAQCRCPAHDDKQASLTISKGEKGIVLYCHAGCATSDVLKAAGLNTNDLFYGDSSYKPNWQKYVENSNRNHRKIEAIYNYHDFRTGAYTFTKIRLEEKEIIYGTVRNEQFTYGLDGKKRKELHSVYGDLKAIRQAIETGEYIYICEGEKDVNTLIDHGYAAFTYGGVSDWLEEYAQIVKDGNVIVLADNDEPGKQVAAKILFDIKNVVKTVKVIIPVPDVPKADVTDYFEAGHSREEFEKLGVTKETSTEMLDKITAASISKEMEKIDAYHTYVSDDKGLAKLYADLFKGRHRYNATRKEYMVYDGKRWKADIEGLKAKADAKIFSDGLLQYAVKQSDSDYVKFVTSLCKYNSRITLLRDAEDVHYILNEDLDQNDFSLNVQNGTLDLSNNEPRFKEHDPNDLLACVCNANYDPGANCPSWDKFINDIMQGDQPKIKYLKKIAGMALTGDTSQECMFILYGATTRNGKSTFVETLLYMLGDYGVSMQPSTLAKKQTNDSRQASGDIARLAGKRLCNASEPPKKMLFDIALLKTLLGRDSITARRLYESEFEFTPKFTLLMNTNYLPQVTDDTIFSSGRVKVITFNRHFKPEEQDKTLKDRLKDSKELAGILNWCIEGLILYRKEGLKEPDAVKNDTDLYRSDSDKIGNFIKDCLIKSDENVSMKDAYEKYTKWCDENGYGVESKGNFKAELQNKCIYAASGTIEGKTVKNIVKGYKIDDFMNADESLKLPFE